MPVIFDATPTWAGVLPAYLAALEYGTDEGKDIAKGEIIRMAHAADSYNELISRCKKLEESNAELLDAVQRMLYSFAHNNPGNLAANDTKGCAVHFARLSATRAKELQP